MSAESVKNLILNLLLTIVSSVFMTGIVIGVAAPILFTMAIFQDIFDFTWFWKIFDYFFPAANGRYQIEEIMWFYAAMTMLIGLLWQLLKLAKLKIKVAWRYKFFGLTGLITLVYLILALSSSVRLGVGIDMYVVYLVLYFFTLIPAAILMLLIWFVEKLREIKFS